MSPPDAFAELASLSRRKRGIGTLGVVCDSGLFNADGGSIEDQFPTSKATGFGGAANVVWSEEGPAPFCFPDLLDFLGLPVSDMVGRCGGGLGRGAV